VVLVTRPREQAEELVRLLEARGAEAIVAPAIEVAPARSRRLDRALDDLLAGGFAWLVVTSRNGVEALEARLRERGASLAAVPARVAAVGEGTAEALRERGVRPELVPRTFTTEALARAFPRGAGRVLLARADVAPPGLEERVAAKGWTPVRVDAYRTRFPRALPAEARAAFREGRVDAVTFTSASTVRGFVRLLGAARGDPRVVCIGPVTARAAREAGFAVHAVARPHTLEGLVAAVERALARRAVVP
ncbi:MAG TPA: uroporphyrinogen-III synthase, partial [Actinomycetota bacterium]|nr:uroporphyrinogen-III synthase [Actinomycetota bacterium]